MPYQTLNLRDSKLYQPPVSRYKIVWETLKSKGVVSLAVPAEAHRRLLKAVKKRRDFDLGFLLDLSSCDPPRKHKITAKSEGSKLTLTLTTYLSSKEI